MIPVTNNKEKPTLGSSKSWPTDHPLHYRTTKSHFKSLHYLQQQQSLVTLVLTLGTYLYTRFQVFRAGNPPYSILWALWEENLTSSDSEPHSEDIVQIGVILRKPMSFIFRDGFWDLATTYPEASLTLTWIPHPPHAYLSSASIRPLLSKNLAFFAYFYSYLYDLLYGITFVKKISFPENGWVVLCVPIISCNDSQIIFVTFFPDFNSKE